MGQMELRHRTDSHWSFQILFKLESSTALTHCSIPMMAKVSIIGGLVAKWAEGGWPLWSNELVSQLKSLVWLCSGLDSSLKDSYKVIWYIVCLVSETPTANVACGSLCWTEWNVWNGCMDGWMEGWVEGWTDGWMDVPTEGWMDGRKDGWTDKWMRKISVLCKILY